MKNEEKQFELPPENTRSEIFFGKGGNSVEESQSLAKITTVNGVDVYFIWLWQGLLFDPYGADILRKSHQVSAKFTRVKKVVFENYIKYLKTKNRIYLTYARRGHIG